MNSFDATMTGMALLSDEDMSRPWKWRSDGVDFGVRDGYHRSLEAELAQLAIVEPMPPAREPLLAMAQAQRALGDALGLVAGQPEELLDFQVAPTEWPLREVLRHLLDTENSYLINTRWSVTRAEDQSVAMPKELRHRSEDAPGDGAVADLMGRLKAARATSNAFVSGLQAADLERPSFWAGNAVDVRFRLHRFASHLTEHTIHAEKLLRAAGHLPAEPRQMVRAIWAARGGHELLTETKTLDRLDQEHAARWESFGLRREGSPPA
jgi:uncharacterized damage-inducible protein DinB